MDICLFVTMQCSASRGAQAAGRPSKCALCRSLTHYQREELLLELDELLEALYRDEDEDEEEAELMDNEDDVEEDEGMTEEKEDVLT